MNDNNFRKLADMILDIIEGKLKKKPQAYDTQAVVRRVDARTGTAYVHIPNGVDETPVRLTIDAEAGDTVQVRVADGRAWLTGNRTAPPTDDAEAIEAKIRADLGVKKAEKAQDTADTAQIDAARARDAADSAEQSAQDAQTAAGAATAAAGKAQAAAENASDYAARALGNLSTVQSVAETLTWITAHGTMALTTDVALDPTHVYFVLDPAGDYTVGGQKYAIVTEPDVADIATYYELTIDESLNNYVGTHLAVDGEGLWLLPAASGTNKVLIATGAGSTYTTAGTYIIDALGNTAASFRADGATVGENAEGKSRTDIDSSGMTVSRKENNVDYQIAHIGYGTVYNFDGTTGQGPYYTFGSRQGVNGAGSVAEGTSVRATIANTHAEGDQTRAEAFCAHAEGRFAKARGECSHAEGNGAEASGINSHAEGNSTDAVGQSSHAEGDGTDATGNYSHAEGYYTTANNYAHSEGYKTEASGGYSHAEGGESTASGTASHAEGLSTATGLYSHGEGYGTHADGSYSHAGGYHTAAATGYQTVFGKWNDNKSADLFEVGNGTANNARSNALELTDTGDLTTAGDITDGGGNVLADKADSSSLAAVATSGDYTDLLNKPTIPTVNDATLTIQKNGTNVQTFTANASANKTANITVPTQASDIGAQPTLTSSTDISVKSVKVGGHTTAIGSTLEASGSRSISNNSWQNITGCYVTLPAGMWIVTGTVAVPSKTSGRLGARIYNNGDAIAYNAGRTIINYNGNLATNAVAVVSLTAQKDIYLQGYQSSGAAVTSDTCYISAVRIA